MAPPPAVASWLKYVRVLNVLTALVQLVAGVGSLTEIFSLDVPATFLAIYVMLFALLLLAYECRLRACDACLRHNFGFLYSMRGLGLYLLFMGLLDFGMAGGIFGYIAGTSACFTSGVVLSTSLCTTAPPHADCEALHAPTETDRLPTYGSSAFASPPAVAKPKPKPTPPPMAPLMAPPIAPPVALPVSMAPPPPRAPPPPPPTEATTQKKGKNKK